MTATLFSTSAVERQFFNISGRETPSTTTPYLVTTDFPKLGLLTALRFIEWVANNPDGVISLPAKKQAEYFIHFTHQILDNWDKAEIRKIMAEYGLSHIKKPSLRGLHFVQSEEFYPIPPSQHNSAYNFVIKNYIEGFGLDIDKALLINSDEIELANGMSYKEIFPDLFIDLSLRWREAKSQDELIKKQSIFMIDDWCSRYEQRIRELGGIGFFLSTIGPDGHIAYNVRGTDLYSSTRISQTNFETQADAAASLGGIEVAKKRLVITIGLETITYKADATAIIFAAGEANADIVKSSLENAITSVYPATVLQRLADARFYLTEGAACKLEDSIKRYYLNGPWTSEKTERSVIDLCQRINKYAHHLTLDDLKDDPWCSLIPDLDEQTPQRVVDTVRHKLEKGLVNDADTTIYHTGPHHDDIMLGIMPYANRQLRSVSNDVHFAVATSGYNSVTNKTVIQAMEDAIFMIDNDYVKMITYPDFYTEGYKHKRYKDVYHYLDNCAQNNDFEKKRGLCHRVIRDSVEIWGINNTEELKRQFYNSIEELRNCYDGGKNSPEIQTLKGRLREFEEELTWNYHGVRMDHIHHLRLGFYHGSNDYEADIKTILNQFTTYKPNIISFTYDPEGSGPSTHYKVLQTIAEAISEWNKIEDLSNLKIIGYRNVWFKFHPAEATIFIPVSLNSLAVLSKAFSESYLTQVDASFPSPECDGPFSEITRKTWVNQLKQIQLVLGKNFFYESNNALVRSTHGLIFMKEMNVSEFIEVAKELKKNAEGIDLL